MLLDNTDDKDKNKNNSEFNIKELDETKVKVYLDEKEIIKFK